MLRQEHHPWSQKSFSKGANTDLDNELRPDGVYYDALNMRPSSTDGTTGAAKKIGGEEPLYPPDQPGAATYVCIGAVTTNSRRVEFWANSDPQYPPLVRINGVTHAMSAAIPYTYDRPLQMAVVENCRGGVIYPADGENPPLFWDVQDMVDHIGDQTYFADFDLAMYSVGLNAPAHFPVLVPNQPLVDLNGPVGMRPGQYSYSLRYVTVAGDRTNWGMETPLIPVPEFWDQAAAPPDSYPGGQSRGGETMTTGGTRYGINLQFRVENPFGFQAIELRRRSFNDGAGISGAGVLEVVARIAISPGQTDVIKFVDPVGSNVLEVLAATDSAIQGLTIDAPKAVEYTYNRLLYANFRQGSRVADLQFTEIDGDVMFPFTKKLVKNFGGAESPDGYTNPYNATYYKRYQSGERYGFAVMPWDGALGKAPAITVVQSLQMPDRRDRKEGRSLQFSDDPCYAANVDATSVATGRDAVGPTFEAFTQGSSKKTNVADVVNVSATTGDVKRDSAQFNSVTSAVPGNATVVTFGGNVAPVMTDLFPWHPTGNVDTLVDGWNIKPTTSRHTGSAGASMERESDTGEIFAPTHQALGVAINGIENIPSWVSGLTIGRTKAAGRVVCQGIAVYDLLSTGQGEKHTAGFRFFSPDVAAGAVDQATLLDMQSNPSNYRVEFVSPLGFYTENYAHIGTSAPLAYNSASCMDMISYARVLHDEGQVNVGELGAGTMGYAPDPGAQAPLGNYVGWAKWRQSQQPTPPGTDGHTDSYWATSSPVQLDGHAQLGLSSFQPLTSGRSKYYRVRTNGNVYSPLTNDTDGDTSFFNTRVRQFHQPWYIVNIIRDGATVPDSNQKLYVDTGCNIKINSTIGLGTGALQSYPLIDERWEDCIPYESHEFRYIYVGGKAYVNLANDYLADPANLTQAISDAGQGGWTSPAGVVVYGFYQEVQRDADGNRMISVGMYGLPAPSGAKIQVRYDSTAPIRVYGGDSTVAPVSWAVFDAVTNADVDEVGAQEIFGLPLPYAGYGINPRWYMPYRPAETEDDIDVTFQKSIRQWIVLFDAESKIAPEYRINSTTDRGQQTFPNLHYIPRPYKDAGGHTSAAGAGFDARYDDAYPGEYLIWGYGGFRFTPGINYDYAKIRDESIAGLPKSGWIERTDFCNAIAASNVFSPLQQDSPGLRTFTDANLYQLSEENGEIKLIAMALSGGGQNLYALCESGVAKVLVNKNILTDAAGELIATQSIDGFFGDHLWLTRYIGAPDEMWRLFAKSYAPTGGGYADSFFWADRNGVYRMTGDNIVDISRDKRMKRLLPALSAVRPGFTDHLSSHYDRKNNEYWGTIAPGRSYPIRYPMTFAYSPLRNEWNGEYGYQFGQYYADGSTSFGCRGLTTYELDKGYLISGKLMEGWIEQLFSGDMAMQKEVVSFRVHPDKPTRIEIYDKDHQLMFYTDEPLNGQWWIKKVDAWQQLVGRTLPSYGTNQSRVQGTSFYLRVVSGDEAPFRILTGQLQLKGMK